MSAVFPWSPSWLRPKPSDRGASGNVESQHGVATWGSASVLEIVLVVLSFSIHTHPQRQDCTPVNSRHRHGSETWNRASDQTYVVLCGFHSPSHMNWRAFKKAMGGEPSKRWQNACRGGRGRRRRCTPPASLVRDSWRCVTCRPAALLRAVCRRRRQSMFLVAQPNGHQMAASTLTRYCRFRQSRLVFLPG